jgi:hypothetical protein
VGGEGFVGLLDDLKRQAEELKARDVDRAETLRANAEAVDRALRHAFKYLNEMSQQLKLVKLPCPFSYELPKSGVISGLAFRDFSADYRTKHFMDKDYFGEVILVARGHADRVLSIKKSPEEMDRFRDTLWQYNLVHKSEQFRDARRMVTHENFEVNCEVPLQARFEGDHENGRIKVSVKNVGGFAIDVFRLTAQELTDHAIEEFAKYFIGRPGEWTAIVKASVLNPRGAATAPPRPRS